MGLARAIVERAWLVIAVWVAVAVAMAPLAARLGDVVVSEESGFLPPTAESARAADAVSAAGGAAEPDAILVVDGVEVGLEAYWTLRPHWRGVDWRGANHTSWVDVLDSIYDRAYRESLRGVNESLAAVEGGVALWNATLQALEAMEGLAAFINGTAPLLAAADEAYRGYYAALQGYAAALPQLRQGLAGLAALCLGTTAAYARLTVDAAWAEYLIENLTTGYERGYLTEEEVLAVVAASNHSEAGAGPLSPGFVVLVFNYTMAAGGPGAWSNALAARVAAVALNASLDDPRARTVLEALQAAAPEALQGLPDLRLLAARAPEGVLEARGLVAAALLPYAAEAVQAMADASGSPALSHAFRALAARNCSADAVDDALVEGIAGALASGEPPMPPEAARAIAEAVVNGTARDPEAARLLAARLALETVASQAAARGAPQELLEALRSPAAVEALTALDPDASGALAANETLARLAAARLASQALGAPEEAAGALALGASPLDVAVDLVAGDPRTPPEARPLLEAFRERGVPGSLEGLASILVDFIASQAEARGVPAGQARLAAEAAVEVYLGRATLEEAADRLARAALEEAWPRVLGELEGTLVSRDHTAFLVILYGVGYEDALAVRDSVRAALGAAGYGNARVLATGGVVAGEEMREAALADIERSDRVSMLLVFLILLLVLESVVAVFLPFVGIGLGLATAMGVVYLLAKADAVTVTSIARTVMFSTGLGLGIDYAALIARRFREEYAPDGGPRAAAERALTLSWRPVLAGAATAAAGFGSLALAWDFPFLKSIGLTVPIAIAMVTAASLTFIPALLSIVGGSRLLWWPSRPGRRAGPGRVGAALGSAVVRSAPILIGLVVLLLVPAVAVHAGFRGSHDLTLMMPEGTESLEGIRLIAERFDPGVVYPLYVVPSTPDAAQRLAEALEGLGCVASARVVNSSTPYVLVVPSVNPLSVEGVECARQVREAAHSVNPGSLVGGMAAVSLDLEELLYARFYHRVLPAAVTVMFASMLLAYGGAAVALAAVASVAVAAEYAIAATIYYFQELQGTPVPWFLPITVFTAILGVGMDYNSFTISRAAEECRRECSRDAVARAVARASTLVLGLALIMAGAYGGLMLGSSPYMRMMGAALASGVLLAGVLASLALTPPIIALAGRHAWRPWGPKAEGGG